MKKIITLKETELVTLIKRIIKETEEEYFDFEEMIDPPTESNDDDDDNDDYIDDYGFDLEDEFPYDDEFQNKMKLKSHMGKNKMSSIGIGGKVRWDKDSEKEWSPIKPSDMPLEKYLKSKGM
jgi:hypothetical protein